MRYHVYILYSETLDVYYRGQTEDLDDRLKRHNNGNEKSARGGVPWKLIWSTQKASRSEAIKLELRLKNLSRERLRKFMDHHSEGRAGLPRS